MYTLLHIGSKRQLRSSISNSIQKFDIIKDISKKLYYSVLITHSFRILNN